MVEEIINAALNEKDEENDAIQRKQVCLQAIWLALRGKYTGKQQVEAEANDSDLLPSKH